MILIFEYAIISWMLHEKPFGLSVYIQKPVAEFTKELLRYRSKDFLIFFYEMIYENLK